MRGPTIMLVGCAIVVAAGAAGVALLGHPAAGVVLLALSVAMTCTALRHHLRSENRR